MDETSSDKVQHNQRSWDVYRNLSASKLLLLHRGFHIDSNRTMPRSIRVNNELPLALLERTNRLMMMLERNPGSFGCFHDVREPFSSPLRILSVLAGQLD